MKAAKIIRAADLFCGAGGTTTGLLEACRGLGFRLDLVVVNHWPLAIQTHMANHPWARHVCASLTAIDPPSDGQKTLFQCIDAVDPAEATKGRKLDLLVASPECTDHSVAKGGKPRSDQSRSTAWCILRWADTVHPRHILVENVPEFVKWGPLGVCGNPLKSRRGDLFKAFLASLDALGYRVEWRILNAADYGDATTRRRFFLQAARGRRKITWPAPTHAPAEKAGGLGLEPWRPAREVIDWSLEGRSIFGRKKPLAPNTLRRIAKGIEKYWGDWAQPFLVMMYGTSNAASIDEPLPTVTAKGCHHYLAEPFLIATGQTGSNSPRVRSIEEPVPTLVSKQEQCVVEPFLVRYQGGPDGERRVHPIDAPLPVQDTSNRYALAEPFLLPQQSPGVPRGVSRPAPTVAAKGAISVVEPFLVPQFGERPAGKGGRAQEPRTHPVGKPVPAVTSHGAGALVEPFLLKYYRTGRGKSVGEPMDTITAKHRFALVEPGVVRDDNGGLYALDIRFRMLQPHELAAAMSFPDGYEFAGNKGEQVRQIGNAVAVRTAEALCREALTA